MNDSIVPVYSQRANGSGDNQYENVYRSAAAAANGSQSSTGDTSPQATTTVKGSQSPEDTYRAMANGVKKSNSPEASIKNSDPISAALGDATLQKIFSNKDILAIYEKMSKSEPLNSDEQSNLVKFRDDNNITNTSINQYLDFKKSIYTKLGSAPDTDSFIQSWQSLDQLPVEVKNSILSDLKGKLGDKIKDKGFDIDTVLKFDASTLKGNTAIAEAISKSFKELAGDQEFLKKFEDNQQVGSTQSVLTKTGTGATVGTIIGGAIGASAGGVGAIPGAWLGAQIGGGIGLLWGGGSEAIKPNSGLAEGTQSFGSAIGGAWNGLGKGLFG
jgi:hypothetical protein